MINELGNLIEMNIETTDEKILELERMINDWNIDYDEIIRYMRDKNMVFKSVNAEEIIAECIETK